MKNMVNEIIILSGSAVAGSIFALILKHTIQLKNKRSKITKPLHNAKEELQTLEFEKNLVSQSIANVYEAANTRRISIYERDRLLNKYKHELEVYNEKISRLEPVVNFSELYEMRNGLVSFLEGRIKAIDQKLLEISQKSDITPHEMSNAVEMRKKAVIEFHEKKKMIDNNSIGKKNGIEETQNTDEKSLEEIQKEIMQALTRLEQAELDKD